jgi:hypothetical protein
MAKTCAHLNEINKVTPSGKGCKECLEMHDTWVHLRLCLECGHVGCCDSSKNKMPPSIFTDQASGHGRSSQAKTGAGATTRSSVERTRPIRKTLFMAEHKPKASHA